MSAAASPHRRSQAVLRLQGFRLLVRAVAALLLANLRYWSTVAPLVRSELARWRGHAESIQDPVVRELALRKLDRESFNAEAGAMLATFAPASRRGSVIEAIVALQVLFDFLDGLTERPSSDPLGESTRLFAAFTDAVRPFTPGEDLERPAPCDYMHELSGAARGALAALPARGAVSGLAVAAAQRAAESQIRMHAAGALGTEELRSWAQANAPGTGLGWRELAAGSASSVLIVHVLSAAAADPRTTAREASELARAYLSVCVLLTLLDSLTDHEQDTDAGEVGYISLYEEPAMLAAALAATSQRAVADVRQLPNGAAHLMILTGVIAYYTSTPGARSEIARSLVADLHESVTPLITPTLFVMRSWRLARSLRRHGRHWREQRSGGLS